MWLRGFKFCHPIVRSLILSNDGIVTRFQDQWEGGRRGPVPVTAARRGSDRRGWPGTSASTRPPSLTPTTRTVWRPRHSHHNHLQRWVDISIRHIISFYWQFRFIIAAIIFPLITRALTLSICKLLDVCKISFVTLIMEQDEMIDCSPQTTQ